MVDDGESVRDRAMRGSWSVNVGDEADGGSRARQKVSLSLISSWTYLMHQLTQFGGRYVLDS